MNEMVSAAEMARLTRAELTAMVKNGIAHAKTGTISQVPDILRIPASNYFDPGRFQLEIDRIFKRVPLMLAPSAELPNPGDFKTMEVLGVPVLLSRGQNGEIRAFINSCVHRGANVATAPSGNTKRFMCPYHGWTYNEDGALMGIASPHEFGEVDKSCLKLKALPVAERAGLIWVIVNPNSDLDIDLFLSGYDRILANFGFDKWHFFQKRVIKGPNWKIAYDGYLDFYHLPVLHKATFGADMFNQALYYAWGPHQRVQAPLRELIALESKPEEEWGAEFVLDGVWTIFPHISIASFDGGGRGVMISQLLPGETVDVSYTTQMYLMEKIPNEKQARDGDGQFKLLEYVVQEEDYFTGLRQQRALKAGGIDHVMYGRNEGGAQRFHGWVERILATEDKNLNRLFSEGEPRAAAAE
jgi:nitrite reductase/ring-hydroxylating ferredoxin subunit